jgi:hypothetical protein
MSMSTEIERLTATITDDQRQWCAQHTFREWPEWLIENGVITLYDAPTTEDWWRLFRVVYTDATGWPPPDASEVTLN